MPTFVPAFSSPELEAEAETSCGSLSGVDFEACLFDVAIADTVAAAEVMIQGVAAEERVAAGKV